MTEHDVRLKTLETQVACAADQNVLDAFLRSNTWLPHGCSQGTCGSCKMQVLEGEIDHNASSEFILTPQERQEGLALACQATPRSDLLVEPVAELADDGVVRHPLRDVLGTVTALEDIARDTRRLVIDLDEPMPFTAGQYVELLVPGTEIRRQYSMANAPADTALIELHVRRTEGGAATAGWIFAYLGLGDRVEVRGPMGVFGIGRPQDEPAILVAGGTGLAPMKSIVAAALAEDLVPELWLYHGGRPSRTSTTSGSSAISTPATSSSTTGRCSPSRTGTGPPGWSPTPSSTTSPPARASWATSAARPRWSRRGARSSSADGWPRVSFTRRSSPTPPTSLLDRLGIPGRHSSRRPAKRSNSIRTTANRPKSLAIPGGPPLASETDAPLQGGQGCGWPEGSATC